MACDIQYKGKVYTHATFMRMLHDGLLEDMARSKQIKIKGLTEQFIPPKTNDVKSQIAAISPATPEEAVMQYFATGGKINTVDMVTELGIGSVDNTGKVTIRPGGKSEFRRRIGLHSRNAPSIDGLWELISEEFPGREIDSQEFRNMVVSVLNNYDSRSSFVRHFEENYNAGNGQLYSSLAEKAEADFNRALAEQELESEEFDELLDEYEAIENDESIVSDEEYQELYSTVQEYANQLNNQEYEEEKRTNENVSSRRDQEGEATESIGGNQGPTQEEGGRGGRVTPPSKRTYQSDFSAKQTRKKILGRVYKSVSNGEVRDAIARHGLIRDVASEIISRDIADQIIEDIGLANAYSEAQKGTITGAPAALIMGKMQAYLRSKISPELTTNEQIELFDMIAEVAQAIDIIAVKGGQFNKALDWVYQDNPDHWSYEAMVERYVREGGELTDDIKKKFEQWAKLLEEKDKRIAELEEQRKRFEERLIIENIVEGSKRSRAATKGNKPRGRERIAQGLDKLNQAMGSTLMAVGDVRPEITDALVDIGMGLIEEGVATIENVIDKIRDYLKTNGKTVNLKDYAKSVFDKIERNSSTESLPGLRVPNALLYELYEEGYTDMDAIVGAVNALYPEYSERQIRDAISGYGRMINPTQDEIQLEINRMRRMMRLISGLEDVAAKKRPLRSGKQREKLDAEERALNKELREAMKELPMDEETLANQQKTALDSAKTRLSNQIEELELEIQRGEAIKKSKKTLQEDAELRELREQRDRLKEERDELLRDEEQETAKKLEQAKERARRRIEELKTKLENKDFAKKPAKTFTGDKELNDLRADKMAIQHDYDKERYKNELHQRDKWQKLRDNIIEMWNLPRIIKATGEMSWIFIQNGYYTFYYAIHNPKVLGQAFTNLYNAMASESKSQKMLGSLRANELYALMKDSKLSITEPDAKLSAREELSNSNWLNFIWDNVLGLPILIGSKVTSKLENPYKRWKALNIPLALERASVGYSNTLKVARFMDGVQMLEKQGIQFKDDPQAYKNVADVINTLSGRSTLYQGERAAKLLSAIFFSPRLWMSTLKVASPIAPIWYFSLADKSGSLGTKGKLSVAQKMAMTDFMTTFSLTAGVILAAAAYYNNDDDDDTEVNFDPLSSDFMTIRLGNTRIDPWRGMRPLVVLQTRLLLDSMSYSSGRKRGRTIELGLPYKSPSKGELMGRFVRNKLAPSASILYNGMTAYKKKVHGEVIKVDSYGNPLYTEEALYSNLYPIYAESLQELYEDQPETVATFLSMIGFIGVGVNTYGTDKK